MKLNGKVEICEYWYVESTVYLAGKKTCIVHCTCSNGSIPDSKVRSSYTCILAGIVNQVSLVLMLVWKEIETCIVPCSSISVDV